MTAFREIDFAEVPSSQVNFSFCLISSIESDANQNQISPETSIAPALVITPFMSL